jgi:filamentous hemagglutinin family protein
VERAIINTMEQMRDFDFVSFEHDVLVALGGISADLMSALPQTVVAGLVAAQSGGGGGSLSVVVNAGRIYQFAVADAVATGSIPQDTNIIVQQGFASAQTLTLIPPSTGQSQWNLIQAQFSQVDAVRTGDPNGGVVPFYNPANPSQPTLTSINTVRKGVCVLQVITGSAATTGSEVPPSPTSGWVPLYLIDLAGGQTQIGTSQILPAGPSIGTGVSSAYPYAPFLAGLLASHHSGTAGQAPKIKLTNALEVQGVLPYANMSPVRTLLTSALTLYVNGGTGSDTNIGTAPSIPFKTIQAAISTMYRNYDFNGFSGTISVANGSYLVTTGQNTYAVVFQGMPVGMSQPINIVGNIASAGSVTIGATNGNGILANQGAIVNISGFTITTTGSAIGIVSSAGYGVVAQNAYITLTSCVLGSCGTAQVTASIGGTVVVTSSLSLTGTTLTALTAILGGVLWTNNATITVTGLVVTTAFAYSAQGATIEALGNTFIGSATGPRWQAVINGTISTGTSGSATYFPGNSNGAFATGGQYS